MPERPPQANRPRAADSLLVWLRSRGSLPEVTWILLVLVIPLSTGQRRTAPFLSGLLSLPGMLELGLVVASGLIVYCAVRKAPREFVRRLGSPWLLPLTAYAGLGLLSAAFSEFRLPALAYTVQVLVGLFLTVVVFGGLSGERGFTNLRPLGVVAGLSCVWVAATAAVNPAAEWIVDVRGDARLGGVGLHPNQLGFQAALLGVVGVDLWLSAAATRRRIAAALVVALALPILIATRGRADSLGFAVGVMAILLFAGQWKWIAGGLVGLITAIALAPRLASQAIGFVNRGLELQTVSGRVAIWDYLIRHSLSSWKGRLIGEGIGTSPLVLRGAVEQWPFPSHAHNLLVEALNNAGIPGVVLVLASLATVGYGAWVIARRGTHAWRGGPALLLAVYILVLSVSVVEHSFAGRANIYGFSYWALAAASSARLGAGLRTAAGESPADVS